MEQYFSDLVIHFYVESKAKPKMLQKLANSFGAHHEIHGDLSSLTAALSAVSTSVKNQIIILERYPSLSDHQTLNILRSFPTIVLDEIVGDRHGISKKHPYWKANGFLLGSNLENIAYPFLKMSISSMMPYPFTINDTFPWNAAIKTWNPERDANRKLSDMLERFLDSTCPNHKKQEEIIEFAKYVQNRGKGRGTFKINEFSFVTDAERVVVTASLDWHNKSEQSLKVLYNGLTKCPYSYAYINIANPRTLEVTGMWDLNPSENQAKTLMVSGLAGVKLDKRHMYEPKQSKKTKVVG